MYGYDYLMFFVVFDEEFLVLFNGEVVSFFMGNLEDIVEIFEVDGVLFLVR